MKYFFKKVNLLYFLTQNHGLDPRLINTAVNCPLF